MGCLLCDCNNEKNNNQKKLNNKIDLSILNNSRLTTYESPIPSSSIDYSSHIENRFIFDVNMGEGSFGFSMKIIEKPTKKEYSLKILPKDNLLKITEFKDIKNYYEYNRKILINSSYINRTLSIYENEDNFFIIRDLAPLTLRIKINNSKLPFKLREVKNIMFQLLKNVKYLHDNNIIHGNIKPENILFFDKNEIKLEDDSHFIHFQRNNKISDYLFISPEILENILNEKCDEWSCGIIMYFLLCGKYPFPNSNIEELTNHILKDNFIKGEEYNNLSLSSQDLISKLLTLNPKLRINAENALNHQFFEKDPDDFFLLQDDNISSESDNCVHNRNIDSMMKIYFIFIIIFNKETNVGQLFTNYVLGDGFEVENEKWRILKFLSDNLICYEDENVKHIINYLYNNNIFLFGDNLRIVFEYFCGNQNEKQSTIKLKDIVYSLKILVKNINNNNSKFTDNILEKNLSYEEFKYIISSNI